MKPTTYKWVVRSARWLLGGLFIYAGALKIADPLAFADSVTLFWILPAILITPVALGLPMLEVLLGLALVANVRRRVSAIMVALLCAIFAVALVQALARGIPVDCGCFGEGAASIAKTIRALLRDVGLGAVALIIARKESCGRD